MWQSFGGSKRVMEDGMGCDCQIIRQFGGFFSMGVCCDLFDLRTKVVPCYLVVSLQPSTTVGNLRFCRTFFLLPGYFYAELWSFFCLEQRFINDLRFIGIEFLSF